MKIHTSILRKGFTLIELLIVIAILGVLASAVLLAINPLEQLARSRDAGRKSSVRQLGEAVQAYYTGQNSTYPTADANWMTTIQTSGEIKALPQNPTASGYTQGCYTGSSQKGYCYQANATDAIVYARAESNSSVTTAGAACVAPKIVWIMWSSLEGKTGVLCTNANTDPLVTDTGLK